MRRSALTKRQQSHAKASGHWQLHPHDCPLLVEDSKTLRPAHLSHHVAGGGSPAPNMNRVRYYIRMYTQLLKGLSYSGDLR